MVLEASGQAYGDSLVRVRESRRGINGRKWTGLGIGWRYGKLPFTTRCRFLLNRIAASGVYPTSEAPLSYTDHSFRRKANILDAGRCLQVGFHLL